VILLCKIGILRTVGKKFIDGPVHFLWRVVVIRSIIVDRILTSRKGIMYTIVHRKLNSGAQCAPAWICSDNGAQRRQTQIYECFGQHTWGEKAECVA
jgi:hypothetical protein